MKIILLVGCLLLMAAEMPTAEPTAIPTVGVPHYRQPFKPLPMPSPVPTPIK
jgi:hypothetical protein